jgi:hypothetical protein
MDYSYIVPLLALVTLLAVLILAAVSRRRTQKRLHGHDEPKSTAARAPSNRPGPPDT